MGRGPAAVRESRRVGKRPSSAVTGVGASAGQIARSNCWAMTRSVPPRSSAAVGASAGAASPLRVADTVERRRRRAQRCRPTVSGSPACRPRPRA